MRPCRRVDLIFNDETDSSKQQMLKEFVSVKTYGQVTNVYDHSRSTDNEDEVKFDINLHLKRDDLPCTIGNLNSRAPDGRMLVQIYLVINDCSLEDVTGCIMVIHMDQHDRLVEGLLHVYFVDSLYEPMNLHISTKFFSSM
jgi:hypothetical protein